MGNSNSTDGIANKVYEGSASLGVMAADTFLYIGVVIGIFILLSGLYSILYNDDDKYLRVQGKVMKSICKEEKSYDSKGNTSIKYNCNISVQYMIDGKVYSKLINIDSSTDYIKDQPIALQVNKMNMNDARIATISGAAIGLSVLCCALLLMSSSYLNYYLAHRSKLYAAGEGIGVGIKGARTIWDILT